MQLVPDQDIQAQHQTQGRGNVSMAKVARAS